jgi:hypothetical protein
MPACPICTIETTVKRDGTPYWTCSGCGVWWQDPMPPKLWHGPHEAPPEQMSDADKAINEQMAAFLLREVMDGKPGPTLDVGVAYPYMASCLKRAGCDAMGIDGEAVPNDLGVHVIHADFEDNRAYRAALPQLHLITFIHSFEHVYDPLKVMRKARALLADNGGLFIRMPDNQVAGIERDLTPGHYLIHPFVHALSSIAELCARTGAFRIERTYELRPGQRDMILRPL